MTQATQKLMGAALLAEVNKNPKMTATELAVLTGYTKQTRSRSGEPRIKPDREAYYEALLLAKDEFFGLVLPEVQRTSSRGDTNSFKVQANNSGIVPKRFMQMLGCKPGEYFCIEEDQEDGTLSIVKDVERSEAAARFLSETTRTSLDADNEENEEENDDDDDDSDGDELAAASDKETVNVEQPAIPGVSSTTVRIPQAVS